MSEKFTISFDRQAALKITGGLFVDFIAAGLFVALFVPSSAPLPTAILLLIIIYIFHATYTAYRMLKRWAWFNLFEKKDRVEATINEFRVLKFPCPEKNYKDVKPYFEEIALSPDVSAEARYLAGKIVGVLNGAKFFDRSLESAVLEEAIRKYQLENMPNSPTPIADETRLLQ